MSALEISNISKTFAATAALTDVSIRVEAGEIHGLLGENGAGKSTLTKILSGVVRQDTGTVRVDGTDVTAGRPRSAREAGIAIAYQEMSSPGNITVAEKLLMPRLPHGILGLLWWRDIRARAREILARWGMPDIDPLAFIDELDLADRQHVEIIAAMHQQPRLLVLDEATAALPSTEWLFAQIRTLQAAGTAVIYISHKLAEIAEICDRGTVLRNGRVVDQFDPRTASQRQLVELMIGRSVDATYPEKRSSDAAGESVLRVTDLQTADLHGVTLHADAGEVVGVAGLDGQGQKDLFYALAGLRKIMAGSVDVAQDADRARRRRPFRLIPEDRKTEGLFMQLSTAANLVMSNLADVSRFGLVIAGKERRRVDDIAARVSIAKDNIGKSISALSGGNQQKALIGNVLMDDPVCLLLFDPTRGVDAGTKLEIYRLIRAYADKGGTALMYSTEVPELVGLCDRIYTVYDGRISGEFIGDAATEERVLTGALGMAADGDR